MRCHRLVTVLAVAGLLVSRGWGQSASQESEKREAEKLRLQIEVMQEKLKALEAGHNQRRRITELGGTRAREEPPRMVVRVYDLSDLLTIAPPYPAMNVSDFGGQGVPLFPAATGPWSGIDGAIPSGMVGYGGMGGMGGMGTGGSGAVPAVPRPGGMGGGYFNLYQMSPGARSSATAGQPRAEGVAAARTSIDELIEAITSTIAPDQWDSSGGPASIAPLGNSLLISATEPMHEQITTLFDSFRQRWGTHRTVSLEAHWLWLTDAQLTALLAAGEKLPGPTGEVRAFGLVNDLAWEKVSRELQQKGDELPGGYHAVITCYNGQTVHVFSGSHKHFVNTMIPVVGDQAGSPGAATAGPGDLGPAGFSAIGASRSVGYQPVVSSVQEGAALQVTPMLTVRGKFVVLDVHSRVIQVEEKQTAGRPAVQQASPAMGSVIRDVVAAVDRPLLVNHHLETTLRVPVDRRMLVGGMTFNSRPQAGDPSLYLFVKIAVQELRDDQPETKGESTPPAKPGPRPAPGPERK